MKNYFRKHGLWGSRFYFKYYNAKERCNNPKSTGYSGYGGRGIKMDWEDFEQFKTDMYDSYLKHVHTHGEKNTTLERVDVNQGYNKKNCVWATTSEQSKNKRTSRFHTYNGVTLCYAEWEQKFGLGQGTLKNRMLRSGWSFDEAIIKIDRRLKGNQR